MYGRTPQKRLVVAKVKLFGKKVAVIAIFIWQVLLWYAYTVPIRVWTDPSGKGAL